MTTTQNRQKRLAHKAAFLSLAALASVSCADILGFEHGHLDPDSGAGPGGSSSGGTGGASRGGASGTGGDAAIDGSRDDGPGRGGNGGADSGAGGAGRAGNSGSTIDAGSGGSGGGSGASGGSGGSGASGGGAGTGLDSGGTGARDGSGGAAGGGGANLDASSDRGPTCGGAEKLCGSQCVGTNDPTTGCAEAACTPCAFPNATATCNTSGQCAIGSCSPGFDNCNTADPKDGCETDLSKADTCGSCTNKCTASAPLCSGTNGSYQCVTGCTAPTSTLCGSQCVDIDTNATHCGDCTTVCMTPTNGDPACANRACDFTCHGGYHKCTASKTCASDTDVNACGANCVTCAIPVNGMAHCTSGSCGFTCNANYHACGSMCADDNSPATCGTSCSACMPPTDPNADPAPTCVNKQCGFKCKAGYNLCSGVCSDTNSVLTCGASCTACTKPANASTVTCNGTTCGFTCNPGYEPSGTQCVVATNLYVSTTGSDNNAGTQASPFRTWRRAAQLAQGGVIVNFAAGTYDAVGGDNFGDVIPAGVTLQRNGSGTVIFAGDGQHALTFAGSGTVQNITVTNFGSPFVATTGTQTIKGVTVTQSLDAVRLSGNALMVISDGSSISGGPAVNRYLFNVESSAQLTLRDTSVTGTWDACVTPTLAGDGIHMSGSATVSLINVTFGGIMGACLDVRGSSKLSLTNSTLMNTCGGGVGVYDTASIVSTNSSFGGIGCNNSASLTINGGSVDDTALGINLYGANRVSFRNFRFGGFAGLSVHGAGNYDFGTSGSPGNNTFNPSARDGGGLNVNIDSLSVLAVGNKWIPNEQSADGNGNMPATVVWGPANGKNFSISSSVSTIEF